MDSVHVRRPRGVFGLAERWTRRVCHADLELFASVDIFKQIKVEAAKRDPFTKKGAVLMCNHRRKTKKRKRKETKIIDKC